LTLLILKLKNASMSHKIIFSLLVLLAGFSGALKAQMVIKPAIGVNFTDFSKNPPSGNFESRTGWQIGGSIMFGKKFYIEPGIFYIEKSTKFSEQGSSPQETDFKLNGIRIPVDAGFKFDLGPLNLRAFGGLSAFFLTGTDNLTKDSVSSTSWGVFAGGGIDFRRLFLDVSYEWSLTDVSKEGQADVGQARSVFIQAGIRISL
jgi:hypothetical protein